MLRAKRVALGLWPHELGLPMGTLRRFWRVEDGDALPWGDWELIEERLREALRSRVYAHMNSGGKPEELFLNPWSLAEIMDVAKDWTPGVEP